MLETHEQEEGGSHQYRRLSADFPDQRYEWYRSHHQKSRYDMGLYCPLGTDLRSNLDWRIHPDQILGQHNDSQIFQAVGAVFLVSKDRLFLPLKCVEVGTLLATGVAIAC